MKQAQPLPQARSANGSAKDEAFHCHVAHVADGALSATDESVRFARQVRGIVHDLIRPNPWIYWTDLVVTVVVAYVGFAFYTESPLWSAPFWLGFFAAAFAFYRATVFSHEITHFRTGTFRTFRIVWNTLCGVPLMFPEFLYSDHKTHHVNHSYGTPTDAEYLPLARGTWRGIVKFIAQAFLVPVMGVVRFVILAPISWFVPSWRQRVLEQSTAAIAINLSCRVPAPEDPRERRTWVIQEACCFAYGVGFFAMVIAGFMPWTIFFYIYALFLFVTGMNYTRTLGAHRYLREGEQATYLEQLLDSNTFPGHPLFTELWAPLGMRYHALHHLVPSMPYHNMGRAHRRLMRDLPADSPYRATVRRNLREAIFDVVRNAWQSKPVSAQPQAT